MSEADGWRSRLCRDVALMALVGAASIAVLGEIRPLSPTVAAAPAPFAVLRAKGGDGERFVDEAGMVFYADRGLGNPAATGEGSGLSNAHDPARTASLPYDQTFALHSLPGASKIVYLDFRGVTISGTAWNQAYAGGGPMTIGPYDVDGNPAVFSTAELDAVQEIWARVAEDFAPMQVDITTEAPPEEAIDRASVADDRFGAHVVITNSTAIYSSCGCGGISYVGSFNYVNPGDPARSHSYYQPGFVFQGGVGSAPKTVAEAASHEIGHSLGLNHDSVAGGGAYGGHGVWAPVMGTGYSRPITQWSKGEYAGATNQEDDLAVMAAHGAIPVGDDVGDTPATATPLGAGSGSAQGVIGSATDRDVFSFATDGGSVVATVSPNPASPNLDARLELLDGSGNVVAADDPPTAFVAEDFATGMGATVRAVVPPGTYYLRVGGTGAGNPSTDGYSAYGSLGRYRISFATGSVNLAPGATAFASAVRGRGPFTVTFSAAQSRDPDGSIVGYQWDFGDGSSSSEPNPTYSYAAPATYAVTLTVTDDQGASSSTTIPVTIRARANRVAGLDLNLSARSKRRMAATAVVDVTDAAGDPLRRALVLGAWGGADRRWVLGVTDDAGRVSFGSLSAPNAWARFDFSVIWTGYLESPYDWDPAAFTTATVWNGGRHRQTTASG